jgi:Fe-S-cluster containining protein
MISGAITLSNPGGSEIDPDRRCGPGRSGATQRRVAGLPAWVYAMLHWRFSHQSTGRSAAAAGPGKSCEICAGACRRGSGTGARGGGPAGAGVSRRSSHWGAIRGEESEERFTSFANDEPCPALDPETGNCELYESRPMTCRVFGPPVESEDGLGVCELCYHGATDAEIAACEMKADPDDMESAVLRKLEKGSGPRGNTIIAYCLAC